MKRERIRHENHPKVASLVTDLGLIESRLVRRFLSHVIRVSVDELPESLSESCILTSNYPGMFEVLPSALKVACLLPGKNMRFLGIGRVEFLTRSNALLAGFVHDAVIPAVKRGGGGYKLGKGSADAKAHLENGGVLWLSPTGVFSGPFEGNGLRMDDVQPGTAMFAAKTDSPIVPMALVADEDGKIKRVVFGPKLLVPPLKSGHDFDMTDYYRLHGLWAMVNIASLLPEGQRGDFEDLEGRRIEISEEIDEFYEV